MLSLVCSTSTSARLQPQPAILSLSHNNHRSSRRATQTTKTNHLSITASLSEEGFAGLKASVVPYCEELRGLLTIEVTW